MCKRTVLLLVITSAFLGCSKKSEGTPTGKESAALARYRDQVKRICECADATCVSGVQTEYTKASSELGEEFAAANKSRDKPTLLALQELDAKYEACGKKFVK